MVLNPLADNYIGSSRIWSEYGASVDFTDAVLPAVFLNKIARRASGNGQDKYACCNHFHTLHNCVTPLDYFGAGGVGTTFIHPSGHCLT
jgi:hypothetical protein